MCRMEKMVELLAPAGNMETLKGVVNAGADAVYLGGDKFSARAFADNFTIEQVLEALELAHLNHRKIYLTLNTLVKEREFDQLYHYIRPMYEAGLDGIIIQDFGVMKLCRECFSDIELHASTQMTITGSEGVRFLQKQGVCRVVPARELSLKELIQIKKETGICLETFIHGSMCYCYSGQCLFSSFLGGRSGNRGRCAQPCRLPYQCSLGSSIEYPLSLKDMCTIERVPELIRAGIDSFKIEGRMKKPEYAAGVTAIYRKYIDQYYEHPEAYQVTAADSSVLNHLYIRSERSEGYYDRRNGKEMITLDKPGYLGADEQQLAGIRQSYLSGISKLPIDMEVKLTENEPLHVRMKMSDDSSDNWLSLDGDVVSAAKNKPIEEADIRKQFAKLGNTPFILNQFKCKITGSVFLPIGQLNEFRRKAIEQLKKELLAEYRRQASEAISLKQSNFSSHAVQKKPEICVKIHRREQLEYLASSTNDIHRIYIPDYLWEKEAALLAKLPVTIEKYLCLPMVTRRIERNWASLCQECDGVLVSNLEQLQWLLEQDYPRERIIADHSLYIWNLQSKAFMNPYAVRLTYPLELTYHEREELLDGSFEWVVYGLTPLMHTANCLQKTCRTCKKNDSISFVRLKDRYQKEFPVMIDCIHCENVIYNSVPLSLHKSLMEHALSCRAQSIRLEFTLENMEQMATVINEYEAILNSSIVTTQIKEYTTGHEKHAVD